MVSSTTTKRVSMGGGDQCGSGALCFLDQTCKKHTDCLSSRCDDSKKTCMAGTCSDGIMNQDESDVDCGGDTCRMRCSVEATCREGKHCASGVCHAGTCKASTCSDLVKNPDTQEAGLDCGFEACGASKLCPTGETCGSDRDCQSAICSSVSGRCLAARCDDGKQNGDETCLDAGGDACYAKCRPGLACRKHADCHGESTCENEICQAPAASSKDEKSDVDGDNSDEAFSAQTLINSATSGKLNALGIESLLVVAPPPPPPPTCSDGKKNGNETGLDCGETCLVPGSYDIETQLCSSGTDCNSDADCQSQRCFVGKCAASTCSDSRKNGGESCIDGGASCPRKCALGRTCRANADCEDSALCSTILGICMASGCSDGLLSPNLNETDTDCGGTVCERCEQDKQCVSGRDCASGICGPGKTCTAPTCADGIRNADEVDIDCSGHCRAANANDLNGDGLCKAGQRCEDSSDCTDSSTCGKGVCTSINAMAQLNDTRTSYATEQQADSETLGSTLGKGIFSFVPSTSTSVPTADFAAMINVSITQLNKVVLAQSELGGGFEPRNEAEAREGVSGWQEIAVYRTEGSFGSVKIIVTAVDSLEGETLSLPAVIINTTDFASRNINDTASYTNPRRFQNLAWLPSPPAPPRGTTHGIRVYDKQELSFAPGQLVAYALLQVDDDKRWLDHPSVARTRKLRLEGGQGGATISGKGREVTVVVRDDDPIPLLDWAGNATVAPVVVRELGDGTVSPSNTFTLIVNRTGNMVGPVSAFPVVSTGGAFQVDKMDRLDFAENVPSKSFPIKMSPPLRGSAARGNGRGYGTVSIRLDCDAYCQSRDASDVAAEMRVHMVYSAVGTKFENDGTAGRVVRKDVTIDGAGSVGVDVVKMALVGAVWARMGGTPILQATLRDASYADAVHIRAESGANASSFGGVDGRINMTVDVRITGYGQVAVEAAERIRVVLDGDGGADADVDSVAWDVVKRLGLANYDGSASPEGPSPSASQPPSASTNSTTLPQDTQQKPQNASSGSDVGGGRLRDRQLASGPRVHLQRQRPATIEQSRPHGGIVPAGQAPSSSPSTAVSKPLSSITVRITLLTEVTAAELQSEAVRTSMVKGIASALDLTDQSLVNITAMYRCGGGSGNEAEGEDPRCGATRRERRRHLGEIEFRRSLGEKGLVHVEFQISGSETTVASVEDKVVFEKDSFLSDLNRAVSGALTTALQRTISVAVQGIAVIERVREGEVVGQAPSMASSGPGDASVDYMMRLLYMGLGALFAVGLFGAILLVCRRLRKRQKIVDDLGGGLNGKKDKNASTYVLAPYHVPRYHRLSRVEVSVQKGGRFATPLPSDGASITAGAGARISRRGGGGGGILANDVAASSVSTSSPPAIEFVSASSMMKESQPSQAGGTLSQFPPLDVDGEPPVLYRL